MGKRWSVTIKFISGEDPVTTLKRIRRLVEDSKSEKNVRSTSIDRPYQEVARALRDNQTDQRVMLTEKRGGA